MFENICSIPLRSDIFTQAIHPTQPIIAVGLSSGHVETYRLPPFGEAPSPKAPTYNNGINKPSALSGKVRGRRRSLENGFGVVEKLWETRRHKGSCRTLCLSADGDVLFSAGTDGIVKAANMETGKVIGKVAIPLDGIEIDDPSVLHALSSQTILVGTDSGLLHVYDLRASSTGSTNPFTSARPSQSWRPHTPKDSPPDAEPITSLTPLPPTSASTSGTSKTWITTAGSTLAVTDLRKGIIKLSEDQSDMLLSSACASGLGLSKSAKRRRAAAGADTQGSGEKIIVGGAGGVITIWERGEWEDQGGRVKIAGGDAEPVVASGTRGFAADGMEDDLTVDALAIVPEDLPGLEGYGRGGRLAVAGLGNGAIRVLRLRGAGGEVLDTIRHDEGGIESVVTLGFEREGRLISGGGEVVKIWQAGVTRDEENKVDEEEEDQEKHKAVDNGVDEDDEMDDDEEDDPDDEVDEEPEPTIQMGDGSDDDNDDSADDSSDDDRPKKKKKKKGKKPNKGGNHGISGSFRGMD